MKPIIITILVYSLILTIVAIYKDCSGYHQTSLIDVIVAGPCCWLFTLLIYILCIKNRKKPPKQKPIKKYSENNIRHTVKIIIKIYKYEYNKRLKRIQKKKPDYVPEQEIFDLSVIHVYDEWHEHNVNGWNELTVSKAQYEFINNKFSRIMLNQKEETLSAMLPYFHLLTRDEINDLDIPSYTNIPYDKKLYRLLS